MGSDHARIDYALRLGDDALILAQRLGEWCGHAPMLEVDLGLANIALDLVGQAQHFLAHAAGLEGQGRDADKLAFRRDVLDFKNCLLVEQPNGDFAQTLARQALFSTWHLLMLERLQASSDSAIAAVASKAVKEVAYHATFATEWVVRLGDGTDESRQRMVDGLDWMWRFIDELFVMDLVDQAMLEAGVGVDRAALRPEWDRRIDAMLADAGLERPAPRRGIVGGREGRHSEHLGHMLCDMQFLQRAYPDAVW
jgi:ring-1,2-phenylacetyl-CoA epoxidase subunit PaaC